MTNLRHYAKYNNAEVVVIGYNKGRNEVMFCSILALPHDEQTALRNIASSANAQTSFDFLVPVLQREQHRTGTDWFTYLVNRYQRNDGSVMSLPIKELSDMNVDQFAYFSGYGRSITELGATDVATTTPDSQEVPRARVVEVDAEATPTGTDPALLAILGQLVEGNKQIIDKLENIGSAKPKRRVTKKKATRRKASTKATPKTVVSDTFAETISA